MSLKKILVERENTLKNEDNVVNNRRDYTVPSYPQGVLDLSRRTETTRRVSLEPMDLDGLGVEFQTLYLVDQELLNVIALITLQLDHVPHLTVIDNGAIASELLLDDLENLLLIKLLRKTLDGGQCLTTIALLDSYMNVILRLLGLTGIFVGFGEGVEGFEVFDGHKLCLSGKLP